MNSIPVNWKSKNGKRYIAVFASGALTATRQAGRLFVYSLP
jgi:hypothetical protein